MEFLFFERMSKLGIGESSTGKHQEAERHPVRRATLRPACQLRVIEPSPYLPLKALRETIAQAVHANATRASRNSLPRAARPGTVFSIALEHAAAPS
jgi:hypothetical protein